VVSEPRFPFVAVDVAPDDADIMSATLFELGADGVEERDATTLVKGAPGKVTLVASFASHDEASAALEELTSVPEAGNPRLEEIVGDAWRDAWKEHFRPFPITRSIVIRPPWEEYEAKAGEKVLVLEPGRAFGTGLHETTSLVAEALEAHADELAGKAMLDVGCGSGILALVALTLGAGRARAVDNDPDVIDVTRENAARNGLEARVTCDTAPLKEIGERFPVVVANIEARVLVPMAAELEACVASGGLLILSGILAPQKEEVRTAYPRFLVEETRERGEWIALVLRECATVPDRRPPPSKGPAGSA